MAPSTKCRRMSSNESWVLCIKVNRCYPIRINDMLIANTSRCGHCACFELSGYPSTIEHTTQTVASMTSLFVALTLYPEVQRRAQAQLDSVVSRDRLPTFEDRSRLPYIEAICKELLRWQLVLPLGTSSSHVV